ncbi:hypothetical protein Q8W71_30670 [Methylobacterium sp. NEAU 140]|uniref:hypothetical protein n=1 Tax=Methylobacterium sp. NEAU 140 TaxID=3064945 RepID=UPI0027339814|nr:hypothetical protein [Methylobacterium sp. NEAU 140]MDP4026956.1 hypothetical protein [Methylobacterium sp. NEAU 140]
MSALTDRQRLELALPACLLFTLSDLPGAFVPADPALAARAEADIAELRENLRTASLEPFADLTPRKRGAVLRRLERVVKGVTAGWTGQSMLGLALTLWYFLEDLTEREVLLLWEGSAMDRAMRRLVPMFEHGFAERARDAEASEGARRLLARLQADGLYR